MPCSHAAPAVAEVMARAAEVMERAVEGMARAEDTLLPRVGTEGIRAA